MKTTQDFILTTTPLTVEQASFTWSAPSNIALVKYWGKKENQLPANPSLSFTLNHCKTITTVNFSLKEKPAEDWSFDLFFEGKPKDSFRPKIETFLNRIEIYLPFLKAYHLEIHTENTFPHSSGIASSASGMAALSMCLMNLEKELYPNISKNYFYEKASFLARLGSGSACRSIQSELVGWGKNDTIKNSTDLYGVPFSEEIHSVFKEYQDTILIVEKGAKTVSSTVGHNLMIGHPFAEKRFDQAHENIQKLSEAIQKGEVENFMAIVESEALTLHAMMMTSMPYFILMKPNTLAIINQIWQFRTQTNIPVCFTLDAGANVHVLYPKAFQEKVLEFIQNELVEYCQDGQILKDHVGSGAKML